MVTFKEDISGNIQISYSHCQEDVGLDVPFVRFYHEDGRVIMAALGLLLLLGDRFWS